MGLRDETLTFVNYGQSLQHYLLSSKRILTDETTVQNSLPPRRATLEEMIVSACRAQRAGQGAYFRSFHCLHFVRCAKFICRSFVLFVCQSCVTYIDERAIMDASQLPFQAACLAKT